MKSISHVSQKRNKHVIIQIPCALIAHGVQHCLNGLTDIEFVMRNVNAQHTMLSALRPDSIVVMDVGENPAQRAEAIAFLHVWQIYYPEVKIIVLIRSQNLLLLRYLSALGLSAIISLYEPVAVIQSLFIRSMGYCETVQLSPQINDLLKGEIPKKLTSREIQVLEKLFNGKSVSVLAEELRRDIRTISTHKRRAMEKLNLKSEKDLHQLGCEVIGK